MSRVKKVLTKGGSQDIYRLYRILNHVEDTMCQCERSERKLLLYRINLVVVNFQTVILFYDYFIILFISSLRAQWQLLQLMREIE